MKLILLELKRITKTRSTLWMAAAAILLCILMAFTVISFTRHYYLDERGNEAYLSGVDAINARNEMYAETEGELTPEIIRSAFKTYHEVYAEYGELPPIDVELERLYPINVILSRVQEVFVDDVTGLTFALHEISPDKAATYYELRTDRLQQYMEYSYEDTPEATQQALAMNKEVKTPFIFNYGIGNSDSYDYLTICILLLALISTVIAAPIFSAEYQSGADDILRCTKYGRGRLAVIKFISAVLLSTVLFVLCISSFLFITLSAFGWDSLEASLQLIRSSLCFAPTTAGGFLSIITVSGLLSFLAVVCFTLFLSARLKNPLVVLAVSAVLVLLPTIISFSGFGGNIENWIRLCLPSGGMGLRNSMYYEAGGFSFLRLGPLSIWSPFVLLGAAIIEIPLFFGLALRAYTKHEAA